jgi:hypothetical protein
MGQDFGFSKVKDVTSISQEAIDRAERTIKAAAVLGQNVDAIEAQCAHARHDEVVLAVVTPEWIFGGARIIAAGELRESVRGLGQGGWGIVFSPGKGRGEIEGRLRDMSEIAAARVELMRKRLQKGA